MTSPASVLAETVARLVAQKEARRRELARLPIEEKVRLLALMQRAENEVRRAAGRPVRPEWPLPEPSCEQTKPREPRR